MISQGTYGDKTKSPCDWIKLALANLGTYQNVFCQGDTGGLLFLAKAQLEMALEMMEPYGADHDSM